MNKDLKNTSKFLSLVLRHKPKEIDLLLDENGWAKVDELIEKMNKKGVFINMDMLIEIVTTNDKLRFAFNENKTSIRANQGHSIAVELQLEPKEPPAFLYHGTAIKNLEGILKNGLQKQSRQHVHLSTSIDTATKVGSRHGKPIVLTILSKEMQQAGYVFYLSVNNVWLTDHVPTAFIQQ